MSNFDVNTIILIICISNGLFAVITLSLWLQNRKQYRGLSFWALEYVLHTLGSLAFFLHNSEIGEVAVVFSDTAYLIGFLFLYEGLQRFFDLRMPKRPNLALIFIFVILDITIGLANPGYDAHNLILSLASIIVFAQALWLLRRIDQRLERATRWMKVMLILGIGINIYRITVALIIPSIGLSQSNMLEMVGLFIAQAWNILLVITMILIVNRRLYIDMRQSRDQLDGILQTAADGILVLEADGRKHLFGNLAAAHHAGYATVEEFLSQSFDAFHKKFELLNEVGQPVDADYLPARKVLQLHEPASTVLCFRTREDGSKRWLSVQSTPVFDPQGRLQYVVTVEHDITKTRQMESALYSAQKLMSLGRLAAGVAHEINSPLQVITGLCNSFTRHQKEGTEPQPLDRLDVETIERNAWRIARIVRSLMSYDQPRIEDYEPADLSNVIQDALILAQLSIREPDNLDIQIDLPQDLPAVYCNRSGLAEALVNLIGNASDAMPGGGTLTLRGWHDAESAEVILQVIDTGKGIPEELLIDIFDPFFTTKEIGKNIGLGLSIVQSILQAQGGRIEADSVRGKGTTFTLYLPVNMPHPEHKNESHDWQERFHL